MSRRPLVLGMSGLLIALVAVFLVALAVGPGDDGPSAEEVQRFEEALLPAVQLGGKTVELGLKVAIADLTAGRGPTPAVVADQARAWVADLESVVRDIEALDAPEGLGRCRDQFAEAADRYLAAARAVRDAAGDPGPGRDALLDAAVSAGRDGDRLYDEAAGLLQAARREARLPPSPDFPSG